MIARTATLLCTFVVISRTNYANAGTYPSSYPFDVSTFPSDYPAVTPSYSYDDSDPGGYIAQALSCQIGVNDTVYPPFTCGVAHYYFKKALEFEGPLPAVFYYASYPSKADYFAFTSVMYNTYSCNNSAFPVVSAGLLESNDYLYEGKAPKCEEYYGMRVTQLNTLQIFDQRELIGGCSGTAPDQVICLSILNVVNYCSDQYIDGSERKFIMPCADNEYLYFVECNFADNYYSPHMSLAEPEEYLKLLSVEQLLFLEALYRSVDRVCHPHTYYTIETETTDLSSSSELPQPLRLASILI